MEPLLTIAIPTYNRAEYIQKALDSILSQIKKDIEIVISDNGSTDHTQEVLKKYLKHPFIRICGFKENKGIDRNIQNVIKNARGKYIHLFSDDDLYTENLLEKIIQELQKTNPSIICLNHFSFSDEGKVKAPFLSSKRKIFFKGEPFFRYCGLGFISSLVFQKEKADLYLDTVQNGKECAHLDVVARIAIKEKGPFVYLGNALVAGRAPQTPRYDMIRSCILYQKELLDRLYQEGLSKRSYIVLVNRLVFKDLPRILYKLHQKSKNNELADKEILESFKNQTFWQRIVKRNLRLNYKKLEFLIKCFKRAGNYFFL